MAKTIAVVQSCYLPWKGYFDLIRQSDEFILMDDAQYTRRDWRNRNRIKTAHGMRWLTVPVRNRGRTAIRDVEVATTDWRLDHWRAISVAYKRALHFETMGPEIEALIMDARDTSLSMLNRRCLERLCELLGIDHRFRWSWEFEHEPGKTSRLVSLCQQTGATIYLSGPTARSYLDEAAFAAAGIQVRWIDYSVYPEHLQLHPPFVHEVSVIDVLLNEGPAALQAIVAPYGAGEPPLETTER